MNKKTMETVKIFDDAAYRYQEKYMDVSPYAEGLSLFCDSLCVEGAHVLDVACGPGNIARYVVDQMPSVKITAIDLSEKMLVLAKANVPSAVTLRIDAKGVKGIGQKFEGILASFIFPYLSNNEVSDFIRDAEDILTPNGLIYISTMQGNNTDSGYVGPSDGMQMFINYHELDYLEETVLKNGFDIILSKLQPFDYGKGNSGTDIIIIGKKRS